MIVQADLILQINAAAIDHRVVVTRQHQAAVVLLAAVRLAQARQRLATSGIQHRVTLLVAELQAQQQLVLQAQGVEIALGFQVVEQVAGVQVLLPALAGQDIGAGVVARDVGVVELAVELEQAQGMAQLPGFVQLVVQA